MTWRNKSFISLDTETTGLDWDEGAIVQVGMSLFVGGRWVKTEEWILDSGFSSCEEAVNVHGITDVMQKAEGADPMYVLPRIATWINTFRIRDLPIVIMNAPFDLNFFITEWKRRGIWFNLSGSYFFDPLVIDRFYSRNRIPSLKHGARNLKALSDRYGIHDYPLHSAGHDSRRVGELALEMTSQYGQILRATPRQIHERQVRWHNNWCDDFESYANRKGFPFRRTEWPHRPISPDEIQEALLAVP